MNTQTEPCPNGCYNWARIFKPGAPDTLHHPKCTLVDSTLIDVWRVTIPGEKGGCICDSEEMAIQYRASESDDVAPLEIVKEKMDREIYEKLAAFNGF